MDWFLQTFRDHPVLSLFLTIALGFFIGQFKYKSFSLGTVTSVLLVGVVVGQMKIDISSDVKQVFFLIFLFSIGYRVGPQFFYSLKKSGLPQLLFSFIIAAVALVTTWLMANLMGYNAGQAAGLFSGSQTVSAVIGVGGDTLNSLNLDPEVKQSMIDAIPVCYAVTYIFGTIGTAYFLAQVGPLFWGGLKKSRQQCVELAVKLGVNADDTTIISSYTNVVFRAYHITPDSVLVGKTVEEVKKMFSQKECPVYIARVRKEGTQEIFDPAPGYRFEALDDVVMQGESTFVINQEKEIGTEFFDRKLLDFQVEAIRVVLTNKEVDGMTIRELNHDRYDLRVTIRKITRGGTEIPLMPETILHRGDMIYMIGPRSDIQHATKLLGFTDVLTEKSDMIAVGIGIVLGSLIGLLAFQVGKVSISLGASGGTLIAGLFFGWLRSRLPGYAQIPQPALWIMTNLGLNAFIAVVGISAAPGFVAGFEQVGPMLFVIGAVASIAPLLVGIIMARYLFKFNVAIGLGCCCGARTTTPGLNAVQDSLESPLPALGYTVTYALGSTLLIICGIILVFMMT